MSAAPSDSAPADRSGLVRAAPERSPPDGFTVDGVPVRLLDDGPERCWVAVPPGAGFGPLPAAARPTVGRVRDLRRLAAAPPTARAPERLFRLRRVGAGPRPGEAWVSWQVVGLVGVDSATALGQLSRSEPLAFLPPEEAWKALGRATTEAASEVPGIAVVTVADDNLVETARHRRAADAILRTLLLPGNRLVLLKGVPGVGKTALVRVLQRRFACLDVPGRLQGLALVSAEPSLFLPAPMPEEELRRSILRQQLARLAVVIVVDEASRLVDRHGASVGVDNAQQIVDSGGRLVLVSDRSSLLERNEAFRRRATSVRLSPAEVPETRLISANAASLGERGSGIRFSEAALERALKVSEALSFAQPHAALEVTLRSIAKAEAEGRTEVRPEAVDAELQDLLAQGDPPARPPRESRELTERITDLGFRGHRAFLDRFAEFLIDRQESRWRTPGRTGPWLITLLVGPPGCGKTTFIELLTSMLCSSQRKVLTLRGGTYSAAHAIQTLRGAPASYVGYEQGSLLGNHIQGAPDGFVVLEEVELAHRDVSGLLLELADGEFTTGDGRQVDVSGCGLILTSNLGFDGGADRVGFGGGERSERDLQKVTEALKRRLDPRLLSRLAESGGVHVLSALSQAALRNIVRLRAERLSRDFETPVLLEDALIERLSRSAGGPRGEGARGVLGQFEIEVALTVRRHLRRERPAAVLVSEPDEPGGPVVLRDIEEPTAETSEPPGRT